MYVHAPPLSWPPWSYLHLQVVKHFLRDWRKLGKCQKVIKHRSEGGWYVAVAVNSEGLLAVTDGENGCVHLLTNKGTFVRSIGKGMLGCELPGVAFDLKGNVWVTVKNTNKVVKLSQYGQHLQTMCHASSIGFNHPHCVAISPEDLIYVCDNHCVTVHDKEGSFLFAFSSTESDSECFEGPRDVAFGSDGLVYVTDECHERVCVWSKEGTFMRYFKTKNPPTCIAASSDSHLLITSFSSHSVMVYTLDGKRVHEFGQGGSDLGRFNGPQGICVDDDGLVCVVDSWNKRVQVF